MDFDLLFGLLTSPPFTTALVVAAVLIAGWYTQHGKLTFFLAIANHCGEAFQEIDRNCVSLGRNCMHVISHVGYTMRYRFGEMVPLLVSFVRLDSMLCLRFTRAEVLQQPCWMMFSGMLSPSVPRGFRYLRTDSTDFRCLS